MSVVDAFNSAGPYALEMLHGWGMGHSYVMAKKDEDEFKQGGSYYLSEFREISQVFIVCNAYTSVSSKLFEGTTHTVVSVCLSIVAALNIPLAIVAGVVKSDAFPHFTEYFGERSIQVLSLLAEYSGDVLRVAMLAAGVALVALGSYYTGGALLAGLTYGLLDSCGLIPHRISHFMEKYIGVVSSIGVFVGGNLLGRVISVLSIAFSVFSVLEQELYFRIDAFARSTFGMGNNVKDCFALEAEQREMDYEEIVAILEAPKEEFALNLSHCSKMPVEFSQLQSNDDFNQFLECFDQYNWESEQNYRVILSKFKTDTNFLQFVRKKYGKSDEEILENIEQYVIQMAEEQGVSKQAYLATKLRDQFSLLIRQMNLEIGVPVQGSRMSLEEGIQYCSKILPYVQALDAESCERQDILLKLAAEAGGYCTTALRDSSNEILLQILVNEEKKISHKLAESIDPEEAAKISESQVLQAYAKKIRADLLSVRRNILFDQTCNLAKNILPGNAANDRDFSRTHSETIGLGFVPLNEDRWSQISLRNFVFSWFLSSFRDGMFENYENYIENYFDQQGANTTELWAHMDMVINRNTKLNDAQKNDLTDRIADGNEEVKKAFYRLFFVTLGVLKHH